MAALLRFGDWTFDDESRELRGPLGAVHLSPKAFDLLGALLEHRPRVASKQELHDRLWANTFVSDSNLARLVKEVRTALGDRAHKPSFLRTVHGFGYAFCGEAVELSRAAVPSGRGVSYRLICGSREFPLADGENVLGRVIGASPWIESATVSRRHARILVSAEGATIEDLGSKNGTYLHGQRLASPSALADGDEIGLGSVVLIFRVAFPVGSTVTDVGRRGNS